MTLVGEPYAVDHAWPRLPPDQALGQVTSVAVDPARDEIYVLHRGTPPVLVFDRGGRALRRWGTDAIPDGGGHFLRLAPNGEPWITEVRARRVQKLVRRGPLGDERAWPAGAG